MKLFLLTLYIVRDGLLASEEVWSTCSLSKTCTLLISKAKKINMLNVYFAGICVVVWNSMTRVMIVLLLRMKFLWLESTEYFTKWPPQMILSLGRYFNKISFVIQNSRNFLFGCVLVDSLTIFTYIM